MLGREHLIRIVRAAAPAVIPMALVTVVVFGYSLGSPSIQRDGVFMLINLLAVVGLWTFVGNSGIISFGHASFLGIGAYTSAILTTPPALKKVLVQGMPSFLANAHTSTVVGLIAAAGVSALFAAAIAPPLMRLAGLAAGIATLSVLVIVNVVLSQWNSVTNGLHTFSGIPNDAGLWSSLPYVLIAIPVAYAFKRSRTGLRLRACREDEIAARSIGIGVLRERSMAWILSAAIVGAAGAVYAHYLISISPSVFYFDVTFLWLTMLVVGGITSLGGAVLGGLVVSGVSEGLSHIENSVPSLQGMTAVALAVFLILVLIIRPGGLMKGREFGWPGRRSPTPEPPPDPPPAPAPVLAPEPTAAPRP